MPDERKVDALIAYARRVLAEAVGPSRAAPDSDKAINWPAYEALLRTGAPSAGETRLSTLFHHIKLSTAPQPPAPHYLPAPLSLDEKILFPHLPKEAPASGRAELRNSFERDCQSLPADPAARFESFYHLFLRYAWAVPGRLGAQGVPLFEEWKAVAALVFANGQNWQKGPAAAYTLAGGDIPGIQDFVYTITSKGAAKGLRGRSFFVQLLSDAIARRLLYAMQLSPANLIYNAGGNFMLLAPAGAQEQLAAEQKKIDRALLQELSGDLALCLAWEPLPPKAVGRAEFTQISKTLKQGIAAAKRRRFQSVAASEWAALFAPQGKAGNRHCAVCHRPLGRDEGESLTEEPIDPRLGEVPRRCKVCGGFQQLAEAIGERGDDQGDLMLAISSAAPPQDGPGWQQLLYRVSGLHYHFGFRLRPPASGFLYTLNQPDFLSAGAQGFRWAANITPRVTFADVERWQKAAANGTLSVEAAKNPPRVGQIRAFDQLAGAATGLKRVGVLRMDVDNLGQVMTRGLLRPGLPAVSTLSRLLETFFSGWLNQICHDINQLERLAKNDADRGDRLYIIYAGGDDLFVVGSWNLLPYLAQRIRDNFETYTGHHPDLHLSAGITLEESKFPLYQGAEHAGNAEEAAKSHRVHQNGQTQEKNAITFLDLTFNWADWAGLVAKQENIAKLLNTGHVPRGLTQLLQDIYMQHRAQVIAVRQKASRSGQPIPAESDTRPYYGPWLWRQVYALTRLARRLPKTETKLQAEVKALQAETLTAIQQTGAAARWVELLTRKEGEQ